MRRTKSLKKNPHLLHDIQNAHKEIIWDVIISPNDEFLISCSDDGYIKIWESESMTSKGSIKVGDFPITSVAISPNSEFLYSACYDGSILQWDFSSKKLWKKISNAHSGAALKLAMDKDGEHLASTGADNKLKVWLLPKLAGKEIFECLINENLLPIKFTNKGKQIVAVTCLNAIQIIDIASKSSRYINNAHDDGIFALTLSSEDDIILTGSRDKSIKLWDFVSGELLHQFNDAHPGRVNRLALALEDRIMISGSESGDIKLWDLDDNTIVKDIATGNQFNIYAITPDSKSTFFVVGYTDGTIQKWDMIPYHPVDKKEVQGLERKLSLLKELQLEKHKSSEIGGLILRQKTEMMNEISRLSKECEEYKNKLLNGPSDELMQSLESQILSLRESKEKEQQQAPLVGKKSEKDFKLEFIKIAHPTKLLARFLSVIDPSANIELTKETEANIELSYRKLLSHYILRHWDKLKPKDFHDSVKDFVQALEDGSKKSLEIYLRAISIYLDIEFYVLAASKHGVSKALYSEGSKSNRVILLEDHTTADLTMEMLIGKKGNEEAIYFDPKDKQARDKAMLFASDKFDPDF